MAGRGYPFRSRACFDFLTANSPRSISCCRRSRQVTVLPAVQRSIPCS